MTYVEHDGHRVILGPDRVPIRAWVNGVQLEEQAYQQLVNTASLPFIHKHVAAMPDVHWGMGATIGSVIATKKAIIPAAVGVDIGCGMMAIKTSVVANDLPDNLLALRTSIEASVPHGRTNNGGSGDRGAWGQSPPAQLAMWCDMATEFEQICEKHPKIAKSNNLVHLGTLGTGNHFIEICLDEADSVWIMLHSGSRGVGGRIGSYFIGLAKEEMKRWHCNVPDANLAYLPEGSRYFDDYVQAVHWAQEYALANRQLMMIAVMSALAAEVKPFFTSDKAVNCHHNYISKEHHYGENVWVTRKGAVRARKGDLGIIPGSMGAKSYIVEGRGNAESFHSCSHGAGRAMSRTEAKKRFTVADHEFATAGVECRKDEGVVDETPGAYKDIDAVMAAQTDLVSVKHTLKQVVCVKG